jgi:hypothetical protein
MTAAKRRLGLGLASVVIAGSTVLALPAVRTPILQAVGHTLVVDDRLESADAVIIAVDAYIEGVLEAADLVQAGRANRVAVFADPPDVIDREFLRRGVPYEDAAARAVRQLKSLGVQTVERIPRAVAGTEDLAVLLPVWCDEQGLDSLIVVTTPDHSRRLRRALNRSLAGRDVRVSVRPARISRFDPDSWWHTRSGARTAIVELQKLLLDFVRHPLS